MRIWFPLLLFLNACRSLPPLEGRPPSAAFTDTESTPLGKAIVPRTEAHPGLSGVFPLRDARHAFAARVLLAQAAVRSLDIQYYIWHQDITGTLLFESIQAAADQGVRVRLLLDDNNTKGLDSLLVALDAHPNIEVRLFNPFLTRNARWFGYLTDFSRLNRRMHNKSFTADNQATIIGGRNVGDEYFGATSDIVFADLDVLAVGPVVREVSADFDRYWASGSSYPLKGLLNEKVPSEDVTRSADKVRHEPGAETFLEALLTSQFVEELRQGTLPLEWAQVRMVSDDPRKGLGEAPPDAFLLYRLKNIIGEIRASMNLISPYFVPTQQGVNAFTAFESQGVRIRVLTNAMEATDVVPVHAGYAKYRRDLLKAGIELYEFRSASPRVKNEGTPSGSSQTSLHAKTFSVDGARVFIGSFNFDPRSADLNTELGFVMESPELARRIESAFDQGIPDNAYEIKLSDDGQILWLLHQGDKIISYDTEPGTVWWQRLGLAVLGWLPIEWLL